MTEKTSDQSTNSDNSKSYTPTNLNRNHKFVDKEIQTQEESYLQNFYKTTNTNHISFFTTNSTSDDMKTEDKMTVSSCLRFLFQTLKERLRNNLKEVVHFIQLLLVLIFGIEAAMIFGIINLLFHLCIKGDDKSNIMPDINEIKEKIYRELNLPTNNQVNLQKKINNYRQQRKKKDFRTDSEREESDEEQEVYVMPDIPSDTPFTSKFSIQGKCGANLIEFELDTGSGHSIINKETFEQLNPEDILAVRKPSKTARDFSGKIIPFVSEVLLNIVFDKCSIKQSFLVSSFQQSTNLIGADCLRSKRLGWEMEGDCKVFIVFKNWTTKKVIQRLPIKENNMFPIRVQNTTELPGGETTLITGTLAQDNEYINKIEIQDIVGFCNINTNLESGDIPTLNSLDRDGTLQIPVQNREFGNKILFKGEKIGIFELLPKNSKIFNNKHRTLETIDSNHKIKPNLENTIKTLEGKINKIKLDEENERSEAGDLSDVVEEMLPPEKIKVSPEIWEDVLKNVPVHLKAKVFKLLTTTYPNVVSKGNVDFGSCTLPNSEFNIELTENNPNVTTRPYRLNSVYEEQIKEVIGEMIDNKLLISESSPYSSGVFIRPRPDSSNTGNVRVRLINDYRQLNSYTKADLFPLPNMKMLLQNLNGQQYFILLDLKDSYQSLRIKESDRYKASILTSFGQFSPLRMMYGFKNAPSWFSRQIARVIVGLPNTMNYMDDILIFGKSYEEALEIFQKVVERLDKAGFRISLPKLKMFQPELKLLGVVINKTGIKCDPAKIEGISQFPIPETKTQVMRFLGCCNFCSDFIQDYSKISAPLYELTGSITEKITMGDKELIAFNKLKEMISKPTMLTFINRNKPVFLEVDASGTAYGAVSYQVNSYSPEDIPKLKAEMTEIMNKKPTELTDSLKEIIGRYIQEDKIPDFNAEVKPSDSTQTDESFFDKEFFPYSNTEVKLVKRKGKVYVPNTIFFTSKKFSEVQVRGWSSLMKELFAIVDIVEKRSDILSMAKSCIILSDCAAVTYLYHQAKSNSLMARYLARLSQYPFQIMIKHKPGEKLCIADNLSRCYTLDPERDSDKISHTQGILVKTPFRFGEIVGPEQIIEALENCEDPMVMSTSSDIISKLVQTEDCCKDAENQIATINSIRSEVLAEVKESLTREKYIKAQQEEMSELYQELLTKDRTDKKIENGIIMAKFDSRGYRRLTPPSLRNTLISRVHLLGHLSYKKLIKIIQDTDVWPKMSKQIQDFCKTCLSCLWIRPPRGQQYKLGYPITGQVGEVLQIDVVSGLKRTEEGSFFATCIDTFSRFVVAFPLRNDRSEEIVKKLETYVFSLFGPPKIIVTDGAMNLGKSTRMKELCNLYKTKIKIRSPYSSRSLGMCERAHSSILNLLRSLSDSFETNWSHNFALAVAIYNSTPHLATGYSPYEIRFGYKNRMWNPIESETLFRIKHTNLNTYSKTIQKKLKDIYNKSVENDKKYKEEMRKKGGRTADFPEGSFILALNKTPAVNEKVKMRPKYYGPFIVRTNLESVVLAESILTGKTTYVHKNFIRLIPEKSLTKYRDMPLYAKRIFGAGIDWQHWEDLHAEGSLKEILKLRNTGNAEYGVENQGVIDEFAPVLDIPQEPVEETEPILQPEENSSDEEQVEQQPTQTQNSEEIETSNRRVRFEIPETQDRPKRLIKAPTKLNL